MSENYTRQHTFTNGIVADGDEVEDEFAAIEAGFAAMEADIAALGLGTLVPTPTAGDAYELVTVNAAGTAFILRPLADIRTWLGLNALAYLNTVAAAQIDSGAVTTVKVLDANITYAKIQNVSATDRILGRSSAGAGVIEEIVCTAAARQLLDDANAAAMLTTLGAAASGLATASGLTMATARLLGRTTASTGALEELSVSSALSLAGGTLGINAADAAAMVAESANRVVTADVVKNSNRVAKKLVRIQGRSTDGTCTIDQSVGGTARCERVGTGWYRLLWSTSGSGDDMPDENYMPIITVQSLDAGGKSTSVGAWNDAVGVTLTNTYRPSIAAQSAAGILFKVEQGSGTPDDPGYINVFVGDA